MYAKWNPLDYILSLSAWRPTPDATDWDYLSLDKDRFSLFYDQSITLPTLEPRNGYIFVGWGFEDPMWSNYDHETGVSERKWLFGLEKAYNGGNAVSPSTVQNWNDDSWICLYPIWERGERTCTVTFDKNIPAGGRVDYYLREYSGKDESGNYTELFVAGVEQALLTGDIECNGYDFLG